MQNTTPSENAGIKFYSARIFEHCNISKSSQKDFRQSIMRKVSGKNARFENFDFRYVDMEDCYFHGAHFENCDFTGVKMRRCNFRSATFGTCKFDYMNIDETPIDNKQIIKQLPDAPNIAREITQSLRRNSVTLGEIAEVRTLTLLEIKQEQEHLRRAIKGNGDYYQKKYGRWSDQFTLRYRLAKLNLSSVVWGHGERLSNLVISSIVVIGILSAISVSIDIHSSSEISVSEAWKNLRGYFFQNLKDFVGVTSVNSIPQNGLITWIIAFSRIIFTGMFVAVIFRSLSRR